MKKYDILFYFYFNLWFGKERKFKKKIISP